MKQDDGAEEEEEGQIKGRKLVKLKLTSTQLSSPMHSVNVFNGFGFEEPSEKSTPCKQKQTKNIQNRRCG